MTSWLIPVLQTTLTPAQYGELADVPPELEWLANITNPKTRRPYTRDFAEFSAFSALTEPARLRAVTRANAIAWRKDMEVRSLPDLNFERIIAGEHLDH